MLGISPWQSPFALWHEMAGDVTRLFDHFAQKVDEYGLTAALLTYATVIAVPEGEPYEQREELGPGQR